jgi:NAD(P)-dependent dehydrogenase (short-subunit alcohol dehydrogenase family)
VKSAVELLKTEPLDAFIINAGAYSIPKRTCNTGYNNVFQINFVSPYYTVRELLPILRKRGGKVIAVGSIAHRYSKTDPLNLDFADKSRSSLIYGNAKRHLMFSLYELFKSEAETSLAVVHPGITFTGITAHYPNLIFAIIKHPMKVIFMSPKKASLSILYAMHKDLDSGCWVGPGIFNIWGKPKISKLKEISEKEKKIILETSAKNKEIIEQQ